MMFPVSTLASYRRWCATHATVTQSRGGRRSAGLVTRLFFTLLLLGVGAGLLNAQEFRGTISGTVADAQGAVIPGAVITVRNAETGAVSTTNVGPTGAYTVPSLAPGTYSIRVEYPGFSNYTRNGVTLTAGDHDQIDVTMQMGTVSQEVVVTADAPLVDSTNGAIGQGIGTTEVEQLPQNGRTPVTLSLLALGVSSTAAPAQVRPFDNGGAASVTIAGAKNQTTETLLDGSPDTDSQLKVAYSPPQDVVQEVQVYAFQSDAAYGHSGGGIVNQITLGGTNKLHGSLYEYNETAALTANNYFNKRTNTPRANTHYNQYGLSIGGPVLIPRLINGRDRAFFEFGYEGIRDSQPASGYLTVPTADERKGDFSALLANGGASYTIYDPASAVKVGNTITRTAFAGNKLPSVNPIAAALLAYYPLPNVATSSKVGLNNYYSNFAATDTYDNEFGRMDINAGHADKLFFDVRHNYRLQGASNYFNNISTGAPLSRINWGGVVDDVHDFNATTVANVRLNWTRYASLTTAPSQGSSVTSVGFPGSLQTGTTTQQLPSIAIGSTGSCNTTGTDTTFACLFTPNNAPNANWNDSFHIFADVTKVLHNHTVKLGVDAREYRIENISYGYPTGQFVFGSNFTQASSASSAAPFGQDLAALELGLPTSGSLNRNVFTATWNRYYSGFVQDDWRVTRNFTLNAGLRFDHDDPLYERHNRAIASFDPTLTTPLNAQATAAYAANPIAQIPVGQFQAPGGVVYASAAHPQLFNTDSYTYSPRIGFAWKPDFYESKTTITGGFSIFVFPVQNLASINSTGYSQTTPYYATGDNFLTAASTVANPFPNGLLQPAGASGGASTNQGLSTGIFNQHMKNAYSERYALSIQQQLDNSTVFQLAYIGAHYVKLQVSSLPLNPIARQYLSTSAVKDPAVASLLTGSVANPFSGLLPGTTLNGATIARGQLLTAYPQYPIDGLSLQDIDNGSENYSSLNARLQRRLTNGLSLIANYTWSKNIEQDTRLNDTDVKYEKRISSFDYPQKLSIAAVYMLPFHTMGGNSIAGHLTHAAFGGWAVSGIYVLQSGAPLGFGNMIYYGGDLQLKPRDTTSKAFDTTQFDTVSADQPSVSVNGVTSQTNIRTFHSTFSEYRADKTNKVDASIARQLKLRDALTGELRLEAFNAFNHAQFGAPSLSATSSGFGNITSQANNPRVMQLSAHIRF
jgi:hypothetical protein